MNSDRDFETTTAEWLNAGSDTTPPHVIDAVLLAAKSTPQERDLRIPWGTSPMKRLAYGVAAVAALVVTVTVVSALSPRFGIGPGSTPSAEPSETEAVFDLAHPVRTIHARLPEGWVANESGMRMDFGEAEHSLAISFWTITALYTEPCISDGRADPPMMRTLDLLAGAFTGWWLPNPELWGDSPPLGQPSTTRPASTTVSGFRARYLEVRIPDDFDTDECVRGRYTTWRGTDGLERRHQPGDVSRIWIIEVGPPPCSICDNTPPLLVIDATSQGEPSAEGLTGLAEIINSLRIEAPPEETP